MVAGWYTQLLSLRETELSRMPSPGTPGSAASPGAARWGGVPGRVLLLRSAPAAGRRPPISAAIAAVVLIAINGNGNGNGLT